MRKALIVIVIVALVGGAGYGVLVHTAVGQDFLLGRAMSLLAPPERTPFDGIEVFMCGTSSPLPDPERAQACVHVRAGDQSFVVDVGAGSVRNFALGQVSLANLSAVLLTHFHSDHVSALPDLNLQSWIAGRDRRLLVLGPEGVDQVVNGFNSAYALDRSYRVAHHGTQLLPPEIGAMEARTIEAGEVWNTGGLTVTAFAVDHSPIDPAVGYRFDYKGRSVAISGDTIVTESYAEAVTGVDLLLTDALSPTLVEAMADGAAAAGLERQAQLLRDVLDYHAHTMDVQEMAREACVGTLAFYHLVPPARNALLTAIFRRGIDSDVILTNDRMSFRLATGETSIGISGES